jgi:hypothetical protein
VRPSRPRTRKILRARLPIVAGLSLLMAGALLQPAAALSIALDKVPLGEHRFGDVRQPDRIVLKAGAGQVGWEQPPPGADGTHLGPWSFDVARDGSIWLMDEVNQRLLMWRPGQADGPARTVALPDDPLERVADFAIAADGGIYASYVPPPGTPEKTMRLAALTPAGKVRWTSETTNEIFNAQLRFGPDATLYFSDPGTLAWTPVATPAGRPIPVAEQRRRTSKQQPLPGGLRLTPTRVSSGQWRFTLADQDNTPLRGWQVTSKTELGGLVVTPALVGGDPVVTLAVAEQTATRYQYEFEVLRLGAKGGTKQRFSLDPDSRTVWGDAPITGSRIGPDGQLYQLRSDRKTGVSIARYSLGASGKPAPTTTRPDPETPATTAPPAAQPPTAPDPTVALPPTDPATQTAARSSSQWLVPGLVALAAGLLAGVGAWRLYRRSHPTAGQDRTGG